MALAGLVLAVVAASTSRRPYATAACSSIDESFFFDASETILDATLSGCYAIEPDGAEANGVGVFTLNGNEQADGDMVFWATSSLTDDGSLVRCPLLYLLCFCVIPKLYHIVISFEIAPGGEMLLCKTIPFARGGLCGRGANFQTR